MHRPEGPSWGAVSRSRLEAPSQGAFSNGRRKGRLEEPSRGAVSKGRLFGARDGSSDGFGFALEAAGRVCRVLCVLAGLSLRGPGSPPRRRARRRAWPHWAGQMMRTHNQADNDSGDAHSGLASAIQVVISLEASQKWPRSVEAFRAAKLAMMLRMAKCLRRDKALLEELRFVGVCPETDDVLAAPRLRIAMGGFAFIIRLAPPKNAVPNGAALTSLDDDDAASRVAVAHHAAVRALSAANRAYAATVRRFERLFANESSCDESSCAKDETRSATRSAAGPPRRALARRAAAFAARAARGAFWGLIGAV
ncbi:hypothetical protein M885DRAFT_206139 [Pelagophyceae sp. CCMP2097]|nr:hypothetical protein M885DRAFT_206139 [Pelagophyceae sp. CCMP2097]